MSSCFPCPALARPGFWEAIRVPWPEPDCCLLSPGLYAGIKFFLIDFIFKRCPRLRAKYDTPYIIWRSLPTDPQLKERSGAAVSRRVGWPQAGAAARRPKLAAPSACGSWCHSDFVGPLKQTQCGEDFPTAWHCCCRGVAAGGGRAVLISQAAGPLLPQGPSDPPTDLPEPCWPPGQGQAGCGVLVMTAQSLGALRVGSHGS